MIDAWPHLRFWPQDVDVYLSAIVFGNSQVMILILTPPASCCALPTAARVGYWRAWELQLLCHAQEPYWFLPYARQPPDSELASQLLRCVGSLIPTNLDIRALDESGACQERYWFGNTPASMLKPRPPASCPLCGQSRRAQTRNPLQVVISWHSPELRRAGALLVLQRAGQPARARGCQPAAALCVQLRRAAASRTGARRARPARARARQPRAAAPPGEHSQRALPSGPTSGGMRTGACC